MNTASLVAAQRTWYNEGHTLPVSNRLEALRRLKQAIQRHEKALLEALEEDLGKSASEAYMCEVGLTLSEISYFQRHLRSWSRRQRKATPLTNFPARSYLIPEPYGVVLIMSPWNYPVLLSLEPLVGALASGNTAILKPSAYSPATSAVVSQLIEETFPPEHVAVVKGGRAENQSLLEQHFDYIFFTGGVTVGKEVMRKASEHLTPVTLELGGKSPVIVDHTADLALAARRIVFGKFLNCGQTCIAPDYILVEEAVHDKFVRLLQRETEKMFGSEPLKNACYGKIINEKHFHRLQGLIAPEKVVFGGESDASKLRIAPTIMDNVVAEDAVMQEEIFGPLLPVLRVRDLSEAYAFIQSRPHPLALYLFTRDRDTERLFLERVPFGGGCVNDTIIHIATNNLPFGGVGQSGMGSYHGRKSFDTFTHYKSVVRRGLWLDIPLRYQPYRRWKDVVIRWFLR